MVLPDAWVDRLRIPVVAAPMTGVSGPALVIEACRSGVIGSFPTHNAATLDELDRWLGGVAESLAGVRAAPVAPNLVVHRTNHRLAAEVECLTRHNVELVITSVGSPAQVVAPLHEAGSLVFADVASLRHIDRAAEAGVDGLVLLTAGAGGQTGSANPLAFVRAARQRFDGVLVLAGGISDGASVLAARALGADLAYMGTKFIATTESLARPAYRAALVGASLDDVAETSVLSGLPANFLRTWLEREAREGAGDGGFSYRSLSDGRDVWAAGHSVSGVDRIRSVADLVERTDHEYRAAWRQLSEEMSERSRAAT
ncbi:NAD(P)H-dependent flavin oxidoreductase [Phytoactinopolyspora limicola]|uniref:NAD(P)H-dependent flavin oxidoreductase n=1 Tax=Phytoactinopolyspora limicola TaxID=2715536 RepID=UPI00140A33EF|nr:nitronate monooxygenase [Phytoactinopolyspora limicola]